MPLLKQLFCRSCVFMDNTRQTMMSPNILRYLTLEICRMRVVLQGIPFRTSHEIVGRSVALCIARKCQLSELTLEDLKKIHPVFDEDVYGFLGVENSVTKFISYGSTGSSEVAGQLRHWVSKLSIAEEP